MRADADRGEFFFQPLGRRVTRFIAVVSDPHAASAVLREGLLCDPP